MTAGISRKQAYGLPFVLPSGSVLDEFDRFCRPIFEQTRGLQRKNTNLRAQRDMLLPKLISGEIDVSGIGEAPLEAAAE